MGKLPPLGLARLRWLGGQVSLASLARLGGAHLPCSPPPLDISAIFLFFSFPVRAYTPPPPLPFELRRVVEKHEGGDQKGENETERHRHPAQVNPITLAELGKKLEKGAPPCAQVKTTPTAPTVVEERTSAFAPTDTDVREDLGPGNCPPTHPNPFSAFAPTDVSNPTSSFGPHWDGVKDDGHTSKGESGFKVMGYPSSYFKKMPWRREPAPPTPPSPVSTIPGYPPYPKFTLVGNIASKRNMVRNGSTVIRDLYRLFRLALKMNSPLPVCPLSNLQISLLLVDMMQECMEWHLVNHTDTWTAFMRDESFGQTHLRKLVDMFRPRGCKLTGQCVGGTVKITGDNADLLEIKKQVEKEKAELAEIEKEGDKIIQAEREEYFREYNRQRVS